MYKNFQLRWRGWTLCAFIHRQPRKLGERLFYKYTKIGIVAYHKAEKLFENQLWVRV